MIKYIILSIILIIVVSFFGYDLKAIIEDPTTQNNLSYAWSGVTHVWVNYLKAPVSYLWNNIFIGILWEAFIHNLSRVDAGAPTELQSAGARLIDIGNQPYRPIGE